MYLTAACVPVFVRWFVNSCVVLISIRFFHDYYFCRVGQHHQTTKQSIIIWHDAPAYEFIAVVLIVIIFIDQISHFSAFISVVHSPLIGKSHSISFGIFGYWWPKKCLAVSFDCNFILFWSFYFQSIVKTIIKDKNPFI